MRQTHIPTERQGDVDACATYDKFGDIFAHARINFLRLLLITPYVEARKVLVVMMASEMMIIGNTIYWTSPLIFRMFPHVYEYIRIYTIVKSSAIWEGCEFASGDSESFYSYLGDIC